jgi:glycosyltransferase involved in cell wall biosynthesis
MEKPFVSIIVPVYNEQNNLNQCIHSLLNQTYPKNKYEIIMVDNGSTDKSKEILEQHPVTIVEETDIQTSYAARNAGIKTSRGDIVAFTDADCVADQYWLEKGVDNFISVDNCGLLAGKINVFARNYLKPNAVELFEKESAFQQKKYIEIWHFGATANMFTSRNTIEEVGFFNADLKSGGDREWGGRVFNRGYKQIYAEDAIIMHPARYKVNQIVKKYRRVIGGLHDITTKRGIKVFLNEIKNEYPQLNDFIRIFKNKQTFSLIQKTKILFVMIVVKATRIFERMRLFGGGKPIKR